MLYTIGHGTRSVPELAAVLTAAAVDVVIDGVIQDPVGAQLALPEDRA